MKLIFIAAFLQVALATSPMVRQTIIPATNTTTVPAPAPYVPPTTSTGTVPATGTTTATQPAGSTISYPAGTTVYYPAGATVSYPVGATTQIVNPTTIQYPATSTVTYPNTGTPTTYPAGTQVAYPAGTTVINQPGTTTTFVQPTTIVYGNYGAMNPGMVTYPQQQTVNYGTCSSAPILYPSGTPQSAYSYSQYYYGATGNTTYVRNADGTTSAVTVVGYTASGYPISRVYNMNTGVTSIVTQTGPNTYSVYSNGVTTNVVG